MLWHLERVNSRPLSTDQSAALLPTPLLDPAFPLRATPHVPESPHSQGPDHWGYDPVLQNPLPWPTLARPEPAYHARPTSSCRNLEKGSCSHCPLIGVCLLPPASPGPPIPSLYEVPLLMGPVGTTNCPPGGPCFLGWWPCHSGIIVKSCVKTLLNGKMKHILVPYFTFSFQRQESKGRKSFRYRDCWH